ncbi:hypothetical protein M9H77_21108 [Catharanthus roseus]|uniref:Uncharacterized protein n=1 Tax=Catharanthus roseus TaxID=4058 RepID=A0ACC0AN40_CATRO|nr:hypothetical protein M9H77_21108 [Catharanthus roseus]
MVGCGRSILWSVWVELLGTMLGINRPHAKVTHAGMGGQDMDLSSMELSSLSASKLALLIQLGQDAEIGTHGHVSF